MQQDAEECLNFIVNTMNEFSSGSIADEIFGYTVVVKSERVDGIEEFIPPQNDVTKYMFLRCTMGTPTNPVHSVKEGIKQALTETVTIRKDDTDVLYKKTSYITSLPNYLIIHLVRFEWKQASTTSMTKACKAKICKRISFDKQLDVSYICDKVISKLMQDITESLNNINKYIFDLNNGITPSVKVAQGKHKNGNYVLEAVITHQGRTADSGHYVSWTRVLDESTSATDENVENDCDIRADGLPKKQEPKEFWHKFDDDEISKFDYQSIDLCGGRSDYHIAVLLLYKAQYVTIEDNNQ